MAIVIKPISRLCSRSCLRIYFNGEVSGLRRLFKSFLDLQFCRHCAREIEHCQSDKGALVCEFIIFAMTEVEGGLARLTPFSPPSTRSSNFSPISPTLTLGHIASLF